MTQRVNDSPTLPRVTHATFNSLLATINGLSTELMFLLRRYGARINDAVMIDGSESMRQPLPLAGFTTADLPDASDWPRSLAYDTDKGKVVFSNGTNWIEMT